jgi:Uma2 family endonuclease
LLKRSEYEALVAFGAFANERVELLMGEIAPMSPIGPEHRSVVGLFAERLADAVANRALVLRGHPFAADERSEPQPDLLVIPPDENRADRHPERAHMVVEVADSSRFRDLGPKALVYARANVPLYVVVDLVERVIRLHEAPVDGEYRLVRNVLPAEELSIFVGDLPEVAVSLGGLVRG